MSAVGFGSMLGEGCGWRSMRVLNSPLSLFRGMEMGKWTVEMESYSDGIMRMVFFNLDRKLITVHWDFTEDD